MALYYENILFSLFLYHCAYSWAIVLPSAVEDWAGINIHIDLCEYFLANVCSKLVFPSAFCKGYWAWGLEALRGTDFFHSEKEHNHNIIFKLYKTHFTQNNGLHSTPKDRVYNNQNTLRPKEIKNKVFREAINNQGHAMVLE